MQQKNPASPPQTLQSLERALEILEALKDRESVRLTDLQQRFSLPKATIHRYLTTLAAHGYVVQNSTDRTYRLGLAAFQLASAAFDQYFLRESARQYLEKLRDISGESVHLSVVDRGEGVCIDRVEGTTAIRAVCDIGQRTPLHSTASGKVLLAFRDSGEIRAMLSTSRLPGLTRNTITNTDVLLQHLDLVRRRGYAIDNQEYSLDLRSFACPAHDRTGAVIAAISVDGPSSRFTMERISSMSRDVLTVASALSMHLGYRDLPKQPRPHPTAHAPSPVSTPDGEGEP